MKKLIVTGISGFLGSYITEHDQKDWDIIGLHHLNTPEWKTSYNIDLGNRNQVQDLLGNLNPDAILHIAALSNANKCEEFLDLSQRINADAPRYLGEFAAMKNIPIVSTSTDLVFDGLDAPYDESASPHPLNTYGVHKLQGEQVLKEAYPAACIARLPLLYGRARQGNCFLDSWIDQLSSGQSISAFTDEYRTPVDAGSAAAGLFLLLNKAVSGLWHLGGKERISRFDHAIKIAQHFNLDQSLIQPSLQGDFQFKAARAADVSLNSEKAYGLGYQPMSVDAALKGLSVS